MSLNATTDGMLIGQCKTRNQSPVATCVPGIVVAIGAGVPGLLSPQEDLLGLQHLLLPTALLHNNNNIGSMDGHNNMHTTVGDCLPRKVFTDVLMYNVLLVFAISYTTEF